jgi:peptidoglycan glycosyltransferase
MKPQTAQVLTDMMISAVSSGTGTAAQISGVEVAGKTGTA